MSGINSSNISDSSVLSGNSDRPTEFYYFLLDVIPISFAFAIGYLVISWFFYIYLSLFTVKLAKSCRSKNRSKVESVVESGFDEEFNSDEPCSCPDCHCNKCDRLKCRKTVCTCVRCTIVGKLKKCHDRRYKCPCTKCHCRHCGKSKGFDNQCKKCAEDCRVTTTGDCKCTKWSLVKKYCNFTSQVNNTLLIGNMLVTSLYGVKFGLFRDTPKTVSYDKLGRQKIYYNEHVIPERFVFFHLNLALMCLYLLSFISVVFLDIFLVESWVGCEADRDCYRQDGSFDDHPIMNCTAILDNPNVTSLCYELKFDLSNAAATAGGLLTFSIYASRTAAAISTSLFKQIQKRICRPNRLLIAFSTLHIVLHICLFIGGWIWIGFDCAQKTSYSHVFSCFVQHVPYIYLVGFALSVPWFRLVACDCCSSESENEADQCSRV